MKKQLIYADYAAATPVDPQVLTAMQPYFSKLFYNPSAPYEPANSVKKDLEAARAHVAAQLGARPAEIIFTAGATEANNLAIRGMLDQFPDSNVVVNAAEHESVLAPAARYAHQQAPVDRQGMIDIPVLCKLIDEQTVLVSVMYANNEVGTVQPIHKLAQELDGIRRQRRRAGNRLPLYLHSDAAQAANYLDLHVARLGVDLMSLNGGKMYGPKQSGALYVHHQVQLAPLIVGGGQERGLRSGTENVAGAVGFAAALELTQALRPAEAARLAGLQQIFYDLIQKTVPQAVVNGSLKHRLPNNVHLSIPGTDNERVLIQLEERGILAAAGSACSGGSGEPSHVLRAMGLTDPMARASLRFSFGRSTSEADIRYIIHHLAQLVAMQL